MILEWGVKVRKLVIGYSYPNPVIFRSLRKIHVKLRKYQRFKICELLFIF